MLKISAISETENALRLRLDGTLDANAFAELEASWRSHAGPLAPTIIVDMSGVVFMSDEAARQLTNRRGDYFHIVNCSPFIEMLLGNISNQKGL